MRVVARQCSRLDRAAVVLHHPDMLIVAGYLRVSPDLRDRYLEAAATATRLCSRRRRMS
jgi:hypothetical protein